MKTVKLFLGLCVVSALLCASNAFAQDKKATPATKNPFEKQVQKIQKLQESIDKMDAEKDKKKIEKIEKTIEEETKKLDKEFQSKKAVMQKKIDKLEKDLEKVDREKNAAKFDALEKEIDKINEQILEMEKFADPKYKPEEDGKEGDAEDGEGVGEKGKKALKDIL